MKKDGMTLPLPEESWRGGWYCFDRSSCEQRWQQLRPFMTSKGWGEHRQVGGVLSPVPELNPHWWRLNHVYVPYCSSDAWSGRHFSSLLTNTPEDPPLLHDAPLHAAHYSFLGSVIVHETIRDLVLKQGFEAGDTLTLAGSSAGAIGVLLNVDRVSATLISLNVAAEVRGVVDSGWFLDNEPFAPMMCRDAQSCPPLEAVRRGLRLWEPEVPVKCAAQYPAEACFLGYRLYPSIKAPLFIFQWLFDEAQMKADNVIKPANHDEWNHIHRIGELVRASLANVTTLFAPSCIAHTVLTRRDWYTIKIGAVTLPQALHCWSSMTLSDLQERDAASKNQDTALHGDVTSKAARDDVSIYKQENVYGNVNKQRIVNNNMSTDTFLRAADRDGFQDNLNKNMLHDKRELNGIFSNSNSNREYLKPDSTRKKKRKRHSRRRCRSRKWQQEKRKTQLLEESIISSTGDGSRLRDSALQHNIASLDGMLADSPSSEPTLGAAQQASYLTRPKPVSSSEKNHSLVSNSLNNKAEESEKISNKESDRKQRRQKNERRKHRKRERRRRNRERRKRLREKRSGKGNRKKGRTQLSGKSVRAIRDWPHSRNRLLSRQCPQPLRRVSTDVNSTEDLPQQSVVSSDALTFSQDDTKPAVSKVAVTMVDSSSLTSSQLDVVGAADVEPILRGVEINEDAEKRCSLQLTNLCAWPHCNPTCPKLLDPSTGEQVIFTKLLESFGLDMSSVARELGMDLHALNAMDDRALLLMLTQ